MERILTPLITGRWIGVLTGFGIACWIWANPSQSTGQITLAEKGMGDALIIGTSSYLPPHLGRAGKVREEDGYVICTTTMTIPEKHDWIITATANGID